MLTVWRMCRGGMGGYASWPDAGGLMDQAAIMIDALEVMSGMHAEMSQDERRI